MGVEKTDSCLHASMSVASSYSSLGDSNTLEAEQSAPASGAEGSYSSDFVSTVDPVDESTRPPHTCAGGQEREHPHEDEDAYEEDAFEVADDSEEPTGGTDHNQQDSHAFEYSDDWDQEASVVVASVEGIFNGNMEGVVEGRLEMVARHEQTVQHPGDDLVELAAEWARGRQRFLLQSELKPRAKARKPLKRRESPSVIDLGAAAELLRRVRRSQAAKLATPVIGPHERTGPRVPMALIERAHVHRLLAHSSHYPPPATPSADLSIQPRTLSTFCSVKTTDLHAKLATHRLSDLCARWAVSPRDENAMSVATSEFVASMLEKQRRVLHTGDHSSVLGVVKTHAVALDRAVEMATRAVSDTKALLHDAQRILSAPNAHACSCNPTTVCMRTSHAWVQPDEKRCTGLDSSSVRPEEETALSLHSQCASGP
jgi:hypothetical protein